MDTEKNASEVRVEEYLKEQEELKQLLEELAVEHTNLQKNNRKLLTELKFRIGEQEDLMEKCSSLKSQVKSLFEQVDDWKTKCEVLTSSLEGAEVSNLELNAKVESVVNAEKELRKSSSCDPHSLASFTFGLSTLSILAQSLASRQLWKAFGVLTVRRGSAAETW
jgi:predicted nuclease with TOPRIM domain